MIKPSASTNICMILFANPANSMLFTHHSAVDGGWGTWTAYTLCSVACGGGERVRERWCDTPPQSGNGTACEGDDSETDVCNTEDCPGKSHILLGYPDHRLIPLLLTFMKSSSPSW